MKFVLNNKSYNIKNSNMEIVGQLDGANKNFLITFTERKDGAKLKKYFKVCKGTSDRFGINAYEVFASKLLKDVLGSDCSSNLVSYDFARLDELCGCASSPFYDDCTEFSFDITKLIAVEYYNKANRSKIKFSDYNSFIGDYYAENCTYCDDANTTLSCVSIMELIRKYCEELKLDCDYSAVFKQLCIISICDYFISNSDRNFTNIVFVRDDKAIKRVVNFDNGFCLGVDAVFNSENDCDKSCKEKNTMLLTIKDDKNIVFSGAEGKINLQESLISDIFDISKNDKKIEKIIHNFLDLDIESYVRQFENEQNYSFTSREKNNIVSYFNYKIRLYCEKAMEISSMNHPIIPNEKMKNYVKSKV